MHTPADAGRRVRLDDHPLAAVAAYYVLLGLVVAAVRLVLDRATLPRILRDSLAALTGGAGLAPPASDLLGMRADVVPGEASLALTAVFAMLGAVLLALPIAWAYTISRQKRGYRQSVVQTLVLLPLVVAGVVVLVKHSLALAFSLAGIVAAVRFRNTLEDSKDAVYIFVATGIGLAAGVELAVALALSAIFNFVTLSLWVTDFGRGRAIGGRTAEARLARALASANRTGEFVARLDDELLKTMAPEQLEALAERAWRRRKRNAPEWGTEEWPRFESMLRVRARRDSAARPAVESALDRMAKQWRYCGTVSDEDGTDALEYGVERKKGTTTEALLAEIRGSAPDDVLDAVLT